MSPTHHIAPAAAGFLTELEGEGFAGEVHRSRAARLVQTTDNGIYQVWSLPLSFIRARRAISRSLRPCHTAFGLAQDRKDLGFAIFCHLHSKSPHAYCQENSTYEAPYFRGDYPLKHQI